MNNLLTFFTPHQYDNINFDFLMGKSMSEATKIVENMGYTLRVTSINEKGLLVTSDYLYKRVNVKVYLPAYYNIFSQSMYNHYTYTNATIKEISGVF